MTTAVQLAQSVAPGVSLGFKNRIINGGMTIDQRNAGASVTPTASQYVLDRWSVALSVSSKLTLQQNKGSVTPPSGFTNYYGISTASAYSITSGDYFAVQQTIEGYNIADFAWGTASAKTVTLSFWVYSSLTGTFGGALNGGGLSYPYTYTISAANTWEQKTITIAGPTTGSWNTTNSVGVQVWFGLGVGSTYSGTAGSWSANNYLSATGAASVVGTNGATFYITGVQLEVGTTATPFEFRDYGRELIMCQRYCVLYAAGVDDTIGTGANYSASSAWCSVRMPVTMRSSPTMSQTTGSNYYKIYQNGGVVYITSFSDAQYYGSSGLSNLMFNPGVTVTANAGTTWLCNNASSRVLFTAEL